MLDTQWNLLFILGTNCFIIAVYTLLCCVYVNYFASCACKGTKLSNLWQDHITLHAFKNINDLKVSLTYIHSTAVKSIHIMVWPPSSLDVVSSNCIHVTCVYQLAKELASIFSGSHEQHTNIHTHTPLIWLSVIDVPSIPVKTFITLIQFAHHINRCCQIGTAIRNND